ncbi:cytochrome B6 [Hydrococcus rivularis NIES-593]|uniref:Cytochrome b6-f complex subunit 6 n=1 Tax=Hydrococcus rivularis NIES-593 TaxID=1921803 RepID=A0A1U7HTR4_9CYAN|nr:Cytochrome B6-F complex subunit VI (PetL) [Pleurocapsa sp. PCC 7327]OKH26928.1 cytochrome B6 [Hydrococcus rivularis NIES-593]
MSMFAVISYIAILLLFTAIALGLYFGFRSIKLI